MNILTKFISELTGITTIYSNIIPKRKLSFDEIISHITLNNTIPGRRLSCDEILSLVAFYNSFPLVKDLTADIFDLVMKEDHERREFILNSLYSELNMILSLYKDNKKVYDNWNLWHPWEQRMESIDHEIDIQLEKVKGAETDLNEKIDFDKRRTSNYYSKEKPESPKVKSLREILERERAKLNNFYDELKNLRKEMYTVPSNIFFLIYQKCHDLLPVVERSFLKPLEKKDEQPEPTEFLSMSLISSIHKLCNGHQFEEMREFDFFQAFNLHTNSKPVKVRQDEKTRVCYLISQLSENVDEEKRSEWIGAILGITGIEKDYYRSKYREPLNEVSSIKNKDFAEALEEILS